MKILLILLLILILLYQSIQKQFHRETGYYIKVFLYYMVSAIHSILFVIPIPLGALYASLVYWYTLKNKEIKKLAIYFGVLTFIILAIPSSVFRKPFQMIYLYLSTNDTHQIDIYCVQTSGEERLYGKLSTSEMIKPVIQKLQKATPKIYQPYKYRPYGNMFRLHCYLSTMEKDIYILHTPDDQELLYVGNYWIPFQSIGITQFIKNLLGPAPYALGITDHAGRESMIEDGELLDDLWSRLSFLPSSPPKEAPEDLTYILYFPDNRQKKGTLRKDFSQISWRQESLILPPFLQDQLYKQYLLHLLYSSPSDKTDTPPFSALPIETKDFIFRIQPMPDTPRNGLYKIHRKTNESELVIPADFSIGAIHLIAERYLLIYEKIDQKMGNIALIKTIDPYAKRYIASKQEILPESCFAIAPSQDRFAYLIRSDHIVSIQLMDTIFSRPTSIYRGNIEQLRWITPIHLAFTEINGSETHLYIINVENNYKDCIKSRHKIELLSSEGEKLRFRIYEQKEAEMVEGTYEMDIYMNITKLDL